MSAAEDLAFQKLTENIVLKEEMAHLKSRFREVLETTRRRALWPEEADKIKRELGL